jgi:cyclase
MGVSMKNKVCYGLAASLAVGFLVASRASGQQDFSKVEVVAEKLGDGVWMLTGAGGNLGVSAGEDGVVLIDDEYAPLTDRILAAIRTISAKPVRFLINTHWHGDHTGGNENLGKAGVLIFSHENVRTRMSVEQLSAFFKQKTPAAPKVALPVVTFTESVTFHLNGDEIEAFHVPPAHTDGDTVIVFRKADVIHTGDLFFNGLYPVIDLESGGSVEGVIGATDRLLALCDAKTKLIPGHGPAGTPADLKAYRDMVAGSYAAVKALVAQGKTKDEAVAAKPTAAWDEKWGKAFLKPEAWVSILWTDADAKLHPKAR